MKSTLPGGDLRPIPDCYILTGDSNMIEMKILPDISDSKSAAYSDESIIGRAFPMKTFSHGENRAISWTAHFIVCKGTDPQELLSILRSIESCVYPNDLNTATPYEPPAICQIQCGQLLGDFPLCVVLKSYSVKFPTDVAWDEETYIPYKFDVDMSFEVVYDSNDLPGAGRIFTSGM
jgi:hypothetical protein